MRALPLLLVLTAAAGCKASRWRDHADKGAESAGAPQKLAGADATVAPPGPGFDVDDKSGHPKGDLVLRLDSFPEPRPGGTNLPTCFPAFPAGEELGSVMCDGKPDSKVALTAGMLAQECYTHPELARVPAAQPITLVGCKRGMIFVNGYTPKLRVDVEVKDVASSGAAPNATP